MLSRIKLGLLKRLATLDARARELDKPAPSAAIFTAKGNASVRQGDWVAAEAAYRHALVQKPGDRDALVNLGFVLKEQKRLAESRVYLQRALALAPDDPSAFEVHYLFGLVAEEEGNLEDARSAFGLAFELKPDFALACRDYCRVLFMTHSPREAKTVLERGLALNPEYALFYFYQGNLHLENQEPDLALVSYQRSVALGAQDAAVYSALGILLHRLGRKDDSLENLRLAERLEPNCIVGPQYASGSQCQLVGDTTNAIANFEIVLALQPSHMLAHSKLLFCLSFSRDGAIDYASAATRFGTLLSNQTTERIAPVRRPFAVGSRPLRVGFVSGDFKAHPVGFFLEGILSEMDRSRIDCIAYSNTADEDPHTLRIRQQFNQWHDIRSVPDPTVVALIHEHNIDIVVDLSGHTGGNRLAVFAARAAPVQISWLGYFASTGVTAMDYVLADAFSVPVGSTEFFVEKVFRLPDTRLCMTPPNPQFPIDVSPSPAIRNGYVTFGCYQMLTKISLEVLQVWSQALAAVPNARLRIQVPHLDTKSFRDALLVRMRAAGIETDRVTLLGGSPWEDYLSSYREVDLLLDTFPYPGGTTTAEALWMGVPTITMRGSSMLSRQGACMLLCVGLDDWIADTEAEFVAKAARFSGDIPALNRLRGELRGKALASPLFDTRRFAGHLADAFESMFLTSKQV
jgi:predicted O-linked N-acetylglucosamine transferase (SPINDLY family)